MKAKTLASKIYTAFVVIAIVGCTSSSCQTTRKKRHHYKPKRLDKLKTLYAEKSAEAIKLRNPLNGWIITGDCDAMLWTAKYATTSCHSVSLEAAESSLEPGRFYRSPMKKCVALGKSKTTWSRDMGMGLIAYGWKCQQRGLLERHRGYGIKNNWTMGHPISDGRVLYTPQIIALLHEAIFRLGGSNSPNRALPSIYPSGLDDYQAHLQVLNIWLREEMEDGITDLMFDALQEHAKREPNNPFYQYMVGLFLNDQDKTISLLLDPKMPVGEYVRCGEFKRCQLAEWLFVANLVLESYK